MPAYLVTGATGQQGSGAVDSLLSKGATVHALTRSASSPAAKALEARGVKVFEGSFDDVQSLATALEGCSGAFMNVLPYPPATETIHAKNFIAAARAAGVPNLVYTSVGRADWADDLQGAERAKMFAPGGFMDGYWASKSTIEKTIQSAGFQHWTILRPGAFFTSFLAGPHGAVFPTPVEGTDYAELKLAVNLDKPLPSVHHADLGKFIAEALVNPEQWSGKTVDIAAEYLSFRQIAAAFEKTSGKKITVTSFSDEEIANAITNPFLEFQLCWERMNLDLDLETMKESGIKMTTLDQLVVEYKDEILETMGVP